MLAPILTLALALLFTLAGIIAVLVIADSVLQARRAYARLMREAALLQAGFAVQVQPRDVRMRRAPARLTPLRRSPALRMQTVPVCAAA